MKPSDSIANLQSKANARLRTYKALAQLYDLETGAIIPISYTGYGLSGEQLYYNLLKIEKMAHKFAEDMCCVDIPEEVQDKTRELIEASVLSLFSGSLQGFLFNQDPRGYALKISCERTSELYAMGISLDRDWGGYGILAPDHK